MGAAATDYGVMTVEQLWKQCAVAGIGWRNVEITQVDEEGSDDCRSPVRQREKIPLLLKPKGQ